MYIKTIFFAKPLLLSLVFTAPLVSLHTPSTFASDDNFIEEVLVTADFRNIKLSQIPASVSVFNQDTIKQYNAEHLEQLLAHAPNVNFSGGTSRARYFQIRGIGLRSQFVEPVNPSVGVVVDGIDMSGVGSGVAMLDVKQIEILNGPQGTLYGANALAGLINIQSNDVEDDLGGRVTLGVANYDSYSAQAVVNLPVSTESGFRLAADVQRSDGFIDNDFLNRNDTNNIDEAAIRAQYQHQFDKHTHLELTALYIDNDNGYDTFSLDNTRHTLSDTPGQDRQQTNGLSAKLSWRVNESVEAQALLSGSNSELGYSYDEDWTYRDFHPDGYNSKDQYLRDRNGRSAELRFLSTPGGAIFNDRSDWLVGFYRYEQDVDLERNYTYSDLFLSEYDTDRSAVYGQLKTQISDHFALTTGVRLERNKNSYHNNGGLRVDASDDLWGARLALNYTIDDNKSAYALISRGYKAGGVNTDEQIGLDQRAFDSETLLNYEVGYKLVDPELGLQLRAALFYQDRKDVQIKSSNPVLRENGSTIFVDFFDNSAQGSSIGLEFSSAWAVTDKFNWAASLGLLDAELNDDDFSRGNGEPAHAPSYQFSTNLSYAVLENLTFNLNVEGKDTFYFSDSHNEQSERYAFLNTSLVYQLEDWAVTAWVKNLTDKDTFVRGFRFGNDPRDGYTGKGYFQYGNPRQFGLKAEYQF